MEFDSEISKKYREAVMAYHRACEEVAIGAQALGRTKKQTREALAKIPVPGPDIQNWRPEDSEDVTSQLELMSVAYMDQGVRIKGQARSLRRVAAVLLELRDRVLVVEAPPTEVDGNEST